MRGIIIFKSGVKFHTNIIPSHMPWGCRNCVRTKFKNKRNTYETPWNIIKSFGQVYKYIITVVLHIEKTVSLMYGERKNFFKLKKVMIIQKNFLWSKEKICLHFKEIFWINKTFFNSKKFFHSPYIKETVFWV